jgi:DNA-binding FadR family transcriptional regulator
MNQRMWEGVKQRRWRIELTEQMAVEYRAIYEAIRARDPDRAALEAERHLRNVISVIFDDTAG